MFFYNILAESLTYCWERALRQACQAHAVQ